MSLGNHTAPSIGGFVCHEGRPVTAVPSETGIQAQNLLITQYDEYQTGTASLAQSHETLQNEGNLPLTLTFLIHFTLLFIS